MKIIVLDRNKVLFELFLYSSPKIRKYILILLKFDVLKVKIYNKTEINDSNYENGFLW